MKDINIELSKDDNEVCHNNAKMIQQLIDKLMLHHTISNNVNNYILLHWKEIKEIAEESIDIINGDIKL